MRFPFMEHYRANVAELKKFSLTIGIAVPLLFSLLPLVWKRPFVWTPWLIGLAVAAAGLAAPRVLRAPYAAWMTMAEGLGFVNSRILLGAVFFAVLTPIGLVMRLLGKDPLRLAFDPGAKSYRMEADPDAASVMRKPF